MTIIEMSLKFTKKLIITGISETNINFKLFRVVTTSLDPCQYIFFLHVIYDILGGVDMKYIYRVRFYYKRYH